MCERGRVYYNCVKYAVSRLYFIYNRAFMVRLEKGNLYVELSRLFLYHGDKLGICSVSVNLRLADTEKVQIRSVYNKYLHRLSPLFSSRPQKLSPDCLCRV
jgi:hypothetical protein